MMKAKGLPDSFWGEAVITAVYVLNRAPTKGVVGMTPFEAWFGKKPAVHHLRTFGCMVHVKNAAPHLRKLDDRSTSMIFIGYEKGSKAYRAYDPVTRRVHVSRDVIFDEQAQWRWEDKGGSIENHGGDDTFTVEYTRVIRTSPATEVAVEAAEWEQREATPMPPSPQPVVDTEERDPSVEPNLEQAMPGLDEGQQGADHELDEEQLDVDHDDAPLRYKKLSELGDQIHKRQTTKQNQNFLAHFCAIKSKNKNRRLAGEGDWRHCHARRLVLGLVLELRLVSVARFARPRSMSAAKQQQEEECGGQRRPAAGNVCCVWLVTALLLLSVLAGGGCLAGYVVLPPSEAPHWLAAVGLALVALPWAFWLATCAYRCAGARAAVAPAASSSVRSRADSPAPGS
ncbi:hypothetical protein GUJ93_ZPchr0011g28333 [Zizania palustris]|uniref:Retroviral polymerase SH3-like domain-containing protein n=1 Tax=Zizania palustris TaxID=103762 RepID=A0A8J6BLJ9_ZIZPA|nr:hypothetical protein GUJ93_ZPchr0011g28333 [Zizania palustris]